MNQHPLSAAFPAMSDEDFQALKDSIEDVGVQTPVVIFEGAVIDGWHRWTAAQQLGVHCPTVDLGDVDPVAFVRAANKARRHLNKSQFALIEVELANWAPVGKPANCAPGAQLQTAEDMAKSAGVSVRSIVQAKEVATKAAPEVKEAVKAGAMSLKKAVETTKPPKPAKVVAQPAAPAAQAEPEQDDDDLGDDLHAMLEEMQQECEGAARRLADWERAMAADGREALVTAIKRYEHAEREKALSDQRASQYQRQRDEALQKIKAIGRAVGEPDPDKVVRAVQAMARAAKAEA